MALEQVFVAPHSDDVALSCGGTVALAARMGSPLIVTLFAAAPSQDLSGFARFQHERWGVDVESVQKRRRDEDMCAASALGATVRTAWLDFHDAIYRNQAYSTDEALFGSIIEADLAIVDELVAAIEAFPASEYVVPLAVGNHVDHQLALMAGRQLAQRGHVVLGYVDIPYALTLPSGHVVAASASGGVARIVELDTDALERRWRAIDCYSSQLPVIFRHIENPPEALDAFSRSFGTDGPSELLWFIDVDLSCSASIPPNQASRLNA